MPVAMTTCSTPLQSITCVVVVYRRVLLTVCVVCTQENDAEALRAKVRKLQAEVADSEDTISTLEAQVRKQRTGTVVSKRAPAKVSAVCACVHACVYAYCPWVSVCVVSVHVNVCTYMYI